MAPKGARTDRVLDPSNVSVQLDTLIKPRAPSAKRVEIRIKRATKEAGGVNSVRSVQTRVRIA